MSCGGSTKMTDDPRHTVFDRLLSRESHVEERTTECCHGFAFCTACTCQASMGPPWASPYPLALQALTPRELRAGTLPHPPWELARTALESREGYDGAEQRIHYPRLIAAPSFRASLRALAMRAVDPGLRPCRASGGHPDNQSGTLACKCL